MLLNIFWQQPRQWYEIFAGDIKIGESAKNEVICLRGKKELIQSFGA